MDVCPPERERKRERKKEREKERECCTCMYAYASIYAVVHTVMVSKKHRQRSSSVQEKGPNK